MEQSAEFKRKLERELEKIDFKPVEEIKEGLKTKILVPKLKDPKSSLVQKLRLDSENKNRESASDDPVLVWTCENGQEFIECALDEAKYSGSTTCIKDDKKCSRISDPAEESEKAEDFPLAEVSAKVKVDLDAEESLRDQDPNLQSKENIAVAKDPGLSRVGGKVVLEDIQFKDVFNLEKESLTEEELIKLLLPKEKKELEAITESTKLQSELIDTRSKVLYNQLRREAEAHCLSIQQKAIEETVVYNRPSSKVTKEYSRTILMVMKYLDIQLKKVASSEESILKCVVDDFNKNVQQVFNKVTERKQLQRKKRVSRFEKKDFKNIEKPSHVHNPLVFYFTFVIIMTLFSVFVVHLQNFK